MQKWRKLGDVANAGANVYKILVTAVLIYELLKFRFTKWKASR